MNDEINVNATLDTDKISVDERYRRSFLRTDYQNKDGLIINTYDNVTC